MSTKAESNLKTYGLPFALYGLVGGVYLAYLPGSFIWYSWHPLCMMVAFFALAGNAILFKKVGGYQNTKLHGYLYGASMAIAAFGWYVIYTNKEMKGKAHITTLHAKLGIAALIGYTALAVVGGVFLHPDWGFLRLNQSIRYAHKMGGRLFTLIAWTAVVVMVIPMHTGNVIFQALFAVPLAIFGYQALL